MEQKIWKAAEIPVADDLLTFRKGLVNEFIVMNGVL